MEPEKTYSVKEVAQSVDPPAHNDTVIRYEKLGLLGEVRKSERGHRRFTSKQKGLFRQIFNAKNR